MGKGKRRGPRGLVVRDTEGTELLRLPPQGGTPLAMLPNQLVAYNIRRARELRSWTQDRAAEELEKYLGERWSKASWSAAERSAETQRLREFNADELFALSRAFRLPIGWFFLPPDPPDVPQTGWSGGQRSLQVQYEAYTEQDMLERIFDVPQELLDRLSRLDAEGAERDQAVARSRASLARRVAELDVSIRNLRGLADELQAAAKDTAS